MALLVCVLAAVVVTAGFAFVGMMWISVALRQLLRDGGRKREREAVEPAE
ncbi:hypothetical protein [Asticcacaulis solisilvae]